MSDSLLMSHVVQGKCSKSTFDWFAFFEARISEGMEEKDVYQILQEVLDSDFSLKIILDEDEMEFTWTNEPGRKLSYNCQDNFYMQTDYEEKFRQIMVEGKITLKKVKNSVLVQLKDAQKNYKKNTAEEFILSKKAANVFTEDPKYLQNFYNLVYLLLIAQQMMNMEISFPEPNNLIEIEADTPVLIEKVTDYVEIPNSVGDTSFCSEKVKKRNLFLSSKNRMKCFKRKMKLDDFIAKLIREFDILKYNWKKKKKKKRNEGNLIQRPEIFWKEIIKWIKKGKVKKLVKWKQRFKEVILKNLAVSKFKDVFWVHFNSLQKIDESIETGRRLVGLSGPHYQFSGRPACSWIGDKQASKVECSSPYFFGLCEIFP
jgi:hypothetical protein